jgi:hypothetical protein
MVRWIQLRKSKSKAKPIIADYKFSIQMFKSSVKMREEL